MSRSIDAIFFDLGGTLFSYLSYRAGLSSLIQEAGRRLGSTRSRSELHRAYNQAAGSAAEQLARHAYYLHRELFEETYRGFGRILTGDVPKRDFVDWFYVSQREVMIEQMQLRPDCLDTLRALRQQGLRLEIVSNIDDDFLEPMIERSGLRDHMDRWTSSEAAQSCKPHAAFFRFCLERADAKPERVLFVGDSPVHDIAGARALGMPSVLIEEPGSPPPSQEGGTAAEPTHRIRELRDLLPLVASY